MWPARGGLGMWGHRVGDGCCGEPLRPGQTRRLTWVPPEQARGLKPDSLRWVPGGRVSIQ